MNIDDDIRAKQLEYDTMCFNKSTLYSELKNLKQIKQLEKEEYKVGKYYVNDGGWHYKVMCVKEKGLWGETVIVQFDTCRIDTGYLIMWNVYREITEKEYLKVKKDALKMCGVDV